MPQNDQLERDIFGGSDSELSDEEEDVQERPQQQPAHRGYSAPPDDESSGPDSADDEYVQEAARPKQKSRQRRRKEDDEEVRQRPASKKRKRRAPPPPAEIDFSEMTPEQANKLKLDMQIEAILKPKKVTRTKKRKDNDEVLDRYADEEVSRLREAMNHAAKEDDDAKKNGTVASAKLKLLPEVLEVLRKASLAQSIVDNNLLQGVRRWLEPLPDRSLPALNIQKEFFPILKKMEFIDSAVLKESGLGRVVLFYTKSKRVTSDISRIANELIMTWSRPIIKRSASYRDRIIPTALASEAGTGGARGEKLHTIMARAKVTDKNRVRKNAVAIPTKELGSYSVAPRANSGVIRNSNVSVDADIERRRRNAERLRTLTRKVAPKGG